MKRSMGLKDQKIESQKKKSKRYQNKLQLLNFRNSPEEE